MSSVTKTFNILQAFGNYPEISVEYFQRMKLEDVRKRAYDLQVWAEQQMGSIAPDYSTSVEGGHNDVCTSTTDIDILYSDFVCIKLASGYNSGVKVATTINVTRYIDGVKIDASPTKYSVFNTRTNYLGTTLVEFTNMGVDAAKAKVLEMKDAVITGVYSLAENVIYNNTHYQEITDDNQEDSCKASYEIFAEWVDIMICAVDKTITVAGETVPLLGEIIRPRALSIKYTKNGIPVNDIVDNQPIDNKVYTLSTLNIGITDATISSTNSTEIEALYKTVVDNIQNNRLGISTVTKPDELYNVIINPNATNTRSDSCSYPETLDIECSEYVCKGSSCPTNATAYKFATKITLRYKYNTNLSYLATRVIERNFSIYNNTSSSVYTKLNNISTITEAQIQDDSYTITNIQARIESIISAGKDYFTLPNLSRYSWVNTCIPVVEDNSCRRTLVAEILNWDTCGVVSKGTGWLSDVEKTANSRRLASSIKVSYYSGSSSSPTYFKDKVDNTNINGKVYSIFTILSISQANFAEHTDAALTSAFIGFAKKIQEDRLGITATNCLWNKISNKNNIVTTVTSGCTPAETKSITYSEFICIDTDFDNKVATKITAFYKYNNPATISYINSVNVIKEFSIYDAIAEVVSAIDETTLKAMSLMDIQLRWISILSYISGSEQFNQDVTTWAKPNNYTIPDSLDDCSQANVVNTLLYYDNVCSTSFNSGITTTIKIDKVDETTGTSVSGYPKVIGIKKSNGTDYTTAELQALSQTAYEQAINDTFDWLKTNEGVTQEEIDSIQGSKYTSAQYSYTNPNGTIKSVVGLYNRFLYAGSGLYVLLPLLDIKAKGGNYTNLTQIPLMCPSSNNVEGRQLLDIISNKDSNNVIDNWGTYNRAQWGTSTNSSVYGANKVIEKGSAIKRAITGNGNIDTLEGYGTSSSNFEYNFRYTVCSANKKVSVMCMADNGMSVLLNGKIKANSVTSDINATGDVKCGAAGDFNAIYLFELDGFIIGDNIITFKFYGGGAIGSDYIAFVIYDHPIAAIMKTHIDDTLHIILDSRWCYGTKVLDYSCPSGYEKNESEQNCFKLTNSCGGLAVSCNQTPVFNIMGLTYLEFYRLGGRAEDVTTGGTSVKGYLDFDTNTLVEDIQGRIRRSWFRVTSREGDVAANGSYTYLPFTAVSSDSTWLVVVKEPDDGALKQNKIWVCCRFNDTNATRVGYVTLTQTSTQKTITMKFTQYKAKNNNQKPAQGNDIADACNS
jgi:hypothetical protein